MPLPLVGGPTWRRRLSVSLPAHRQYWGRDTGGRCHREAARLIEKGALLGTRERFEKQNHHLPCVNLIALNKLATEMSGDTCAWAWCEAKESGEFCSCDRATCVHTCP